MDVILNELSLSGQFENENLFLKNLAEVIMVTHLISKVNNVNLFKNYNIWNAKVINSETLQLLLQKKGSDILNKFKIDLSKLSSNPPYWEDNQKHSCDSDSYKYNEIDICNTGLAESSQRDKVILSFKHDLYKNSIIEIMKNSTYININNQISLKLFAQHLYDNKLLNEYEFCKYFFHTSKLNFTKLDNNKKGFEILTVVEKKQFIKQFKVFSKMSWDEIIDSDGIEYKKFNNALSGFAKIDIYKFRISQKYRCFGYRKGENFYVVQFETNHKLSDSG